MGSPSADMPAGGMNPLLLELLRQRRIQQAPMPPAQDPRYQPQPVESPWNQRPINGTPMPYPPHPLPQGNIIRGESPLPYGGRKQIYTDSPMGLRSEQATWMDVMNNRAGGQSNGIGVYEGGYDPWTLEYFRKKYGLKGTQLEEALMRLDELQKPHRGFYESNM